MVKQKTKHIAEGKKAKRLRRNRAGYTTTEVACGWAGAIFEVTRLFGQER